MASGVLVAVTATACIDLIDGGPAPMTPAPLSLIALTLALTLAHSVSALVSHITSLSL